MKNTILYAGIVSLFITIPALSFSQTKEKETMISQDYSLIGKKGLLTFSDRQTEVDYISETSLHWKRTLNNGEILQGTENIFYQRLSDHLHFLNRIEKSGLTISQIIDTKNGTVKEFLSFNDEQSKNGKRGSKFLDAKFEFIK